MEHDSECTGYHTTCIKCGDTELNICISEFGAKDYCNKHEEE